MAQHFLASIYQSGAYALKSPLGVPATQGVQFSIPVQGTVISPVNGSVTANGATINSVIEVLPTGLNQPKQKFFSSETVSALSTKANA